MIDVALETRLTKLPPKVSLPFVKLLHTGHIKPEHLDDILIAGHLAGNAQHLLAFAVTYLSLRLQAVPVTDVIRMALQQNRKINLAWSVKRWRAEHDRLSRAETLKRLAADNIFYDLEGFARHLPDKFPGYLIKSSRRLGMEGLRQRHCVASYHSRILMKHCAIVAVFINGVRWTVELFLQQSDPDNPLRIGQIKTRRNGNPDSATRRAIHAALDIDLPASPANAVDDDDEPIYLENLRRVLPVLRRLGVDEVAVHFEGGGDNGCIDYIDFDHQPKPPENPMIGIFKERRDFENGHWIKSRTTDTVNLASAVDDLAYDYIDSTGVDWYNNEGGYADLTIDVAAGTVTMDVDVRTYNSENAYYQELDIETGEDLV